MRVAIVGGGISGISCMWGLKDTDWDVHLFEAESRLGGHAHSVEFEGSGHSASVETAFVVMNEKSYRQSFLYQSWTARVRKLIDLSFLAGFSSFLKSLKVVTAPTDMSFGVSVNHGAFEWTSASFRGFIGNLMNLFSPWFWRLVFDIVRFNNCATDILGKPSAASDNLDSVHSQDDYNKHCGESLESIGQYLDRHLYSDQFKRYYLIPMGAAPRCIDPDEFCRDFPAATLIRFM